MNANETKITNDANEPEWEIDLIGGTEEHHAEARRIIAEAARNPSRRNEE